ncbi:Rrf2 family transcriptional regulator [soil metagenome]
MFSQTTEYALRVIVYLAGQRGKPATIRQIAGATLIPEGYLAKVLQGLSRAKLVTSHRGLHGGSILARPPEKISVYDVIQSVAPLPRIHTCPLKLKSHETNLCALHRRLDDAMAVMELAFRRSTIADIVETPATSTPLCDVTPKHRQKRAASQPVAIRVSKKR